MSYRTRNQKAFGIGTGVISGGAVVAALAATGLLAGQAEHAQTAKAADQQASPPTAQQARKTVVKVHWRHLPVVTRTITKHTYTRVSVPVYVGGGTSTSSTLSGSTGSSGYSGSSGTTHSAPHAAPAPAPAPAPSSGS